MERVCDACERGRPDVVILRSNTDPLRIQVFCATCLRVNAIAGPSRRDTLEKLVAAAADLWHTGSDFYLVRRGRRQPLQSRA